MIEWTYKRWSVKIDDKQTHEDIYRKIVDNDEICSFDQLKKANINR